MAHLTLNVLGEFQVLIDGVPISSFESDKVRALMVYLAIESGRSHRRATVLAPPPKMPSMRSARIPPWVFGTPCDLAAGDGTRRALRELGVETVCESARCPNRGACLGAGTATFLILGGACTRRCAFCAVAKGAPLPPDPGEPDAVAAAVRRLGLSYAVVTSVTRDDLADGGASAFVATIRAIRGGASFPVEVLVPDFAGAAGALEAVLDAGPVVLNHNLETVPRLYPAVRPGAVYRRSLRLLRRARALAPGVLVKSGLMVGLGEEPEELRAVIRDLAAAGVGALTIGQYLRPRRENLAVARYLTPGEFAALAAAAREAGIAHVAAGALVRSSWRARGARGQFAPGSYSLRILGPGVGGTDRIELILRYRIEPV